MELGVVLDMVASTNPNRVALKGPDHTTLTVTELVNAARQAAKRFYAAHVDRVAYLGPSDVALPVAFFGAALAGVPFCPLNFRLADPALHAQLTATPNTLVVAGPLETERLAGLGITPVISFAAVLDGQSPDHAGDYDVDLPIVDDDMVAVALYTSGTTAEPKAAILRHRHLTAYLLASVDFASADPNDAVLVSVPPYHIAGVSTILTNLFLGRRIVYLDPFDPTRWLALAATERVTHAMVVPTMLARIVNTLDGQSATLPALRTLAYGGAPMPAPVIEAAMHAFGSVDFVNAYGLTETSSTIAVLDGDDHRRALASSNPAERARLSSVGRAIPGIEIDVRTSDGSPCAIGEVGDVYVRGDQVSGEYVGVSTNGNDWFATRDRGHLDADGYLFIEGRSDDTIIRGGENIAPAEIEAALLRHPDVSDCAVVGIADPEWGQRIAAAVVLESNHTTSPDALRKWMREQMRTSKTPERIVILDEIPRTDTGKILRRVVRANFEESNER